MLDQPDKTDWWYPTAFCSWGPREHAAMQRVWNSGRWTMGAEVEAFEHEFAAYHKMKHAIMVNSGSSANLIMVAVIADLLAKRREFRVGVPAIAWSTTYAPLIQHGYDLKLLDVDHTWNADPHGRSMEDVGERGLDMIVGCSILGNPAHLVQWRSIAAALNAEFIEDNCESLGARTHEGELCGTHGLMNSFSFYYSHQIGAIEGGMILTMSDECAQLARILRAHGWSRDVKPPVAFKDEYDFTHFGYNVRPLELHAAIAREQLKKLDAGNEQRRKNLKLFMEMVIHYELKVEPPTPNGRRLAPFGLAFCCDRRDQLVGALRKAGIDCRLPTGGSFRMHKYGRDWAHQQTPGADYVHQAGLFLGNGALDLTPQIEKAVEIMREVL